MTFRKIAMRLMPFLLLCYVVNYVDRANISMAKLQFQDELGFSEAAYGLGAGLFYFGYILFEVPSNMLLARIGARATLMRIMILWGVVTTLTMLMRTPGQFYFARILLGAAEAGFIPGVLLYLTYWFPSLYRARVTGIFFLAVPLAGIVGNPLAGAIIHFTDGMLGFRGWQWLFILEGLPAVLLGIAAYFLLDNKPDDAKWLSANERAQVAAALLADEALKSERSRLGLTAVLRDPKIYMIGYVLFASFTLANVIAFWAPTILKRSGIRNMIDVGLLGAAPAVAGIICLLIASWHSDRSRERRWHVAIPLAIGGIGLFVLSMVSEYPGFAVIALALSVAGHYMTLPVIWSIPSDYVSAKGAAAGIAVMSCMGAVGGALGPIILGVAERLTGSLHAGLVCAATIVISGSALLVLGISAATLRSAQ